MKDNLTIHSDAAPGRSLTNVIGDGYYSILASLLKVRDKYYDLPGQAFDAWHRVDTNGTVQVPDLVIPEDLRPDAGRYQPTKIGVFKHLISRLPLGDPQRFAFVDFGCGKGRCLLLAARFGFGRVVGVEPSEPLCAKARANALQFMNARYASLVEVQCADSTAALLPAGPAVYFFYNPFGERAMLGTMEKIDKHLTETGHEAYAVYVNPQHIKTLREGGFRTVDSGRGQSESWTISYRPPAADSSALSAKAA